jgi:hypothetical protein
LAVKALRFSRLIGVGVHDPDVCADDARWTSVG